MQQHAAGEMTGRYHTTGQVMLVGGAIVAVLTVADAFAQMAPGASWDTMSQEERGRAQQNYRHFRELPENGQRRVEERYRRWQTLEPQRRQQVQRNYERYNSMSPSQRQKFKRGYDRWKVNNTARQ